MIFFIFLYEHFFYILEIIKAPIFHEMKICIIVNINPSYIFIFLSLSYQRVEFKLKYRLIFSFAKQNKQTYQQDFLKERNYIKTDLLMPAIYKTLIYLFLKLPLFKEMPVF